MTLQALFMGQDITSLVTQWDQIEQIKDVLLSDAQFVTSEINITINNSSHVLSPQHPASMIQGRNTYNQSFQIYVNGILIFDGLVQDIQLSPDDQTAVIVADDIMGTLTNAIVVTGSTVWTTVANPGSAMLSILESAGLGEYLDASSFVDAGGLAVAAGATIQYLFTASSNTTALAAVQAIASMASISVFVYNNEIHAKAFEPYQGNGSGLSFPITDRIVRTWTEFDWDTESFNNQVAMPFYTTGTPVSPYTATSTLSVTQNNVTRAYQFDGSTVTSNDQTSAKFFAQTYLARAAQRRGILQFTGGQEFAQSVLGDRHWVTSVNLGLSNFPMEIIEIHRHLDTDDIDITMVALGNANEAPPVLYEEPWTELLPGMLVSYWPGWTSIDTSPGLTGSGLVQYNLTLGGQVARIIPANGYNYSLQYNGVAFQNLDLKFIASMPGVSGATLVTFFEVQEGSTYPLNAYYFSIEMLSSTTATFVLGQFNGGTAYPQVSEWLGSFNPGNFGVEIILSSLVATVLLDGDQVLTFNFNGGSNPLLYWGGIGFAALGVSSGNQYDITGIVVRVPDYSFTPAWPFSLTINYLVVAGGGAGGTSTGGALAGGGGGGGLLAGTTKLFTSQTITVGAGGTTNSSGGSSSIGSLVVATGGGNGGWNPFGQINGVNGGSGGGGAGNGAGNTTGGTGAGGQGNNGGIGYYNAGYYAGGGGGGAGAAGGAGSPSSPGAGGNGFSSSISGSAVTYAGGGGSVGAFTTLTNSAGGSGGGGAGGLSGGVAGTNGLGGGGGGNYTVGAGGNGGSGIVIIAYASAVQLANGGVVTQAGGNFIHTFTASGTFTLDLI